MTDELLYVDSTACRTIANRAINPAMLLDSGVTPIRNFNFHIDNLEFFKDGMFDYEWSETNTRTGKSENYYIRYYHQCSIKTKTSTYHLYVLE